MARVVPDGIFGHTRRDNPLGTTPGSFKAIAERFHSACTALIPLLRLYCTSLARLLRGSGTALPVRVEADPYQTLSRSSPGAGFSKGPGVGLVLDRNRLLMLASSQLWSVIPRASRPLASGLFGPQPRAVVPGRPSPRALGGEAQRVVFQRLIGNPLIILAPYAVYALPPCHFRSTPQPDHR